MIIAFEKDCIVNSLDLTNDVVVLFWRKKAFQQFVTLGDLTDRRISSNPFLIVRHFRLYFDGFFIFLEIGF